MRISSVLVVIVMLFCRWCKLFNNGLITRHPCILARVPLCMEPQSKSRSTELLASIVGNFKMKCKLAVLVCKQILSESSCITRPSFILETYLDSELQTVLMSSSIANSPRSHLIDILHTMSYIVVVVFLVIFCCALVIIFCSILSIYYISLCLGNS